MTMHLTEADYLAGEFQPWFLYEMVEMEP